MNAWLNYMIEANLGLLLLLAAYQVLLSKETHFKSVRYILLAGIMGALTFPVLDLGQANFAPTLSISSVLPSSYALPGLLIQDDALLSTGRQPAQFWMYMSVIYLTGLATAFMLVVIQLTRLLFLIRRSGTYCIDGLHIAESVEDIPAFSFFNFVFIGKANELSTQEKHQIILHETAHAKQYHSLDILLITVLKVFFWFNPFIYLYKKIFIQLHEFEADARVVKDSDVDKYCNLLARAALRSAGFKLANHFNHSLTVKRIEMMRTIKNRIRPWKVAVIILMIPFTFFFVACQDQVRDAHGNIAASVDEHAYPEGGLDNFYKQVRMNLRYPASAREAHTYGKVLVQFIVNENGMLSDFRVLDSPDQTLGEEVVRVLSLSSSWVPARKSGEYVKEQIVLPVHFKLDIPGKGVESQSLPSVTTTRDQTSLSEVVVVGYAN